MGWCALAAQINSLANSSRVALQGWPLAMMALHLVLSGVMITGPFELARFSSTSQVMIG